MSAIARVEPLTSTRALRGPFDYRLPESLRAGIGVGSMLRVPFGRREIIGVVVALAERSEVDEERLLAPIAALPLTGTGEQGVPMELVGLAEWIAREYCSTLARALALVLPPGARSGTGPRRRLVAELAPAGRELLQDTATASTLGARQLQALQSLKDGALAATATGVGHETLRRLERRGLIVLCRRVMPRRPGHLPVGARRPTPPQLTAEQERALAELRPLLARDEEGAQHAERLLDGVTGSGKTEVYLRLAAEVLERGGGAIVLVPEIALTPQIAARFIDRFGDTVAILHSRLRPGERHDEWVRLRSGEARLCVGPRSAIFAPIEDLELIVVDEEHDSSYKHEGDPRYDARLIARERARRAGALLLLGSATPRPETAASVPALILSRRVDGRPPPSVRVLDMRTHAGPDDREGPGARSHGLHPVTAEALANLRRARGKGIVLLNRRGWSNFLSCRSCGAVWSCPECDVALILHRGRGGRRGWLACHHCGHRRPEPSRCTECGSVSVARHGTGTERLEHELAAILDDGSFPVFRLDADVLARGPRAGQGDPATALLRRFEAAAAGILIGTQMVAKGHDFPDVTLGVILDADSTLRFPDFRAEERTFALISQLAGRVGRGVGAGRSPSGQVLVQTIEPQARAIVAAAQGDREGFLREELERRRELSYPPYSSLIRIVCSSPEAPPAQAAAAALRERLGGRLTPSAAQLLGPATLFRLRGRERRVLVLKAHERESTIDVVRECVEALARDPIRAGVNLGVDVDPQ